MACDKLPWWEICKKPGSSRFAQGGNDYCSAWNRAPTLSLFSLLLAFAMTYFSCSLDSFAHGDEDDQPCKQQTQGQLPVDITGIGNTATGVQRLVVPKISDKYGGTTENWETQFQPKITGLLFCPILSGHWSVPLAKDHFWSGLMIDLSCSRETGSSLSVRFLAKKLCTTRSRSCRVLFLGRWSHSFIIRTNDMYMYLAPLNDTVHCMVSLVYNSLYRILTCWYYFHRQLTIPGWSRRILGTGPKERSTGTSWKGRRVPTQWWHCNKWRQGMMSHTPPSQCRPGRDWSMSKCQLHLSACAGRWTARERKAAVPRESTWWCTVWEMCLITEGHKTSSKLLRRHVNLISEARTVHPFFID